MEHPSCVDTFSLTSGKPDCTLPVRLIYRYNGSRAVITDMEKLVRAERLELSRRMPLVPKASVSTIPPRPHIGWVIPSVGIEPTFR